MGRETWNAIKQSKAFYIRTYRACIKAIGISLFLNLIMGLGIYYLYFHRPIRDFYSTSGITPPVKLTPLDEPNYSSKPLLANDQPTDDTIKEIPQ